jgi:hypothetical protein
MRTNPWKLLEEGFERTVSSNLGLVLILRSVHKKQANITKVPRNTIPIESTRFSMHEAFVIFVHIAYKIWPLFV